MNARTYRQEPRIRVGMLSSGTPRLEGHRLLNLLIGNGFHWQREIAADLPGELTAEEGQLVNILLLEEYLQNVVGSEMNPQAPIEFLKAHAVISRSWALRRIMKDPEEDKGIKRSEDKGKERIEIGWEDDADHSGDPFDVCSDDHCQRYQGRQPISGAALRAIEETRGVVLTDKEGKVADCRFSKCCGGKTEKFSACWQDRDYDYLPSQADSWCDLSDLSQDKRRALLGSILKGYDLESADETWGEWEIGISEEELRGRLRQIYGWDRGKLLKVETAERGESGRITSLKITAEEGTIIIGKELRIRQLLQADCLKSSAVWFRDVVRGTMYEGHYGDIGRFCDGKLRLRGRGWGHGVGLCQIGAARMAAEGRSWEEILLYYYPNTIINKIYD